MQNFIISKVELSVLLMMKKANFKNIGVKNISVTLKDSYDGATTDKIGT